MLRGAPPQIAQVPATETASSTQPSLPRVPLNDSYQRRADREQALETATRRSVALLYAADADESVVDTQMRALKQLAVPQPER